MPSPRVTVSTLASMKGRGERIACLTCYDATFTRLLERAGVDVLLVGDSLGMVLQGQETTVPVTLDQMVYHCACVARRRERALLIGDMPFLTYSTPERALATAGRLMQEGGVHMVKLEGGAALVETVAALSAQGVPVCGHLGAAAPIGAQARRLPLSGARHRRGQGHPRGSRGAAPRNGPP